MNIFRWGLRSRRNFLVATTCVWGTPMCIFFVSLFIKANQLTPELAFFVPLIVYLGAFVFSLLTWETWGKKHQIDQ